MINYLINYHILYNNIIHLYFIIFDLGQKCKADCCIRRWINGGDIMWGIFTRVVTCMR